LKTFDAANPGVGAPGYNEPFLLGLLKVREIDLCHPVVDLAQHADPPCRYVVEW